jgi:uncharacterized alpha-E superfamily protein
MLSRVAESLFWLGRNCERAETLARVLDVNYTRAMELFSDRLWRSVLKSVGFVDEPKLPVGGKVASEVFAHVAFDPTNPHSIASAVRVARMNALGIRAELTTEVWEVINVLYLFVEEQSVRSVLREGPSKFLRRVRDLMQGFAGISDATLTHGDGWNFLQVGRFLERAYMTARILEAIDTEDGPWIESQRLLEMCCASTPFMQHSHRAPEPLDAVEFIVLAETFPRSLRYCIREVDQAMHRLSRSDASFSNDAERRLGRLRALLEFTTVDELVRDGFQTFAHRTVCELEDLSIDIESAYFPRYVSPALPA